MEQGGGGHGGHGGGGITWTVGIQTLAQGFGQHGIGGYGDTGKIGALNK